VAGVGEAASEAYDGDGLLAVLGQGIVRKGKAKGEGRRVHLMVDDGGMGGFEKVRGGILDAGLGGIEGLGIMVTVDKNVLGHILVAIDWDVPGVVLLTVGGDVLRSLMRDVQMSVNWNILSIILEVVDRALLGSVVGNIFEPVHRDDLVNLWEDVDNAHGSIQSRLH
jgi:hypothetical protein